MVSERVTSMEAVPLRGNSNGVRCASDTSTYRTEATRGTTVEARAAPADWWSSRSEFRTGRQNSEERRRFGLGCSRHSTGGSREGRGQKRPCCWSALAGQDRASERCSAASSQGARLLQSDPTIRRGVDPEVKERRALEAAIEAGAIRLRVWTTKHLLMLSPRGGEMMRPPTKDCEDVTWTWNLLGSDLQHDAVLAATHGSHGILAAPCTGLALWRATSPRSLSAAELSRPLIRKGEEPPDAAEHAARRCCSMVTNGSRHSEMMRTDCGTVRSATTQPHELRDTAGLNPLPTNGNMKLQPSAAIPETPYGPKYRTCGRA